MGDLIWTPVSEPPPETGWYLVYWDPPYQEGGVHFVKWDHIYGTGDAAVWLGGGLGGTEPHITHWMPRPPGPNAESTPRVATKEEAMGALQLLRIVAMKNPDITVDLANPSSKYTGVHHACKALRSYISSTPLESLTEAYLDEDWEDLSPGPGTESAS